MKDNCIHGYRIADVQINVRSPEYEDSENLSAFACTASDAAVEYNVCFARDICEPAGAPLYTLHNESWYKSEYVLKSESGEILLKVSGDGKYRKAEFDALHPDFFGSHVIMRVLSLPKFMLDFDAFFLHASYIVSDGKAILFTADKQVGKSTQAALWEKHMGAEIINGDRALIRKINGSWKACGSPYSGTSGISKNKSADIAAIVILGQAAENRIYKASPREAAAALMAGASYHVWNDQEVIKCLDLFDDLIECVPFFRLDCLPDVSAAEILRKTMTAEEKNGRS